MSGDQLMGWGDLAIFIPFGGWALTSLLNRLETSCLRSEASVWQSAQLSLKEDTTSVLFCVLLFFFSPLMPTSRLQQSIEILLTFGLTRISANTTNQSFIFTCIFFKDTNANTLIFPFARSSKVECYTYFHKPGNEFDRAHTGKTPN